MISAIIGGVSAAASIFGGLSAQSDAKAAAAQQRELGRLNAGYIREEGAEQLRRKTFEFERIEGSTQAIGAASGLGGRTRTGYLSVMKEQHGLELDWMSKSTDSRAKIAKKGGGIAADITTAQGNTAMWQGISGGLSSFGGIKW